MSLDIFIQQVEEKEEISIFHMVLNKFDTAVIAKIWRNITDGGVHFRHLYTGLIIMGKSIIKRLLII